MPSAGMMQEVPSWKKQIQATKEAKAASGIVQTPGTPGQELPAALANSMKRDKKPFTYLPGGLDLSEIRSPKMQRRIMANQQHAPPPPSQLGQQVLLQPRQQNGNSGPQPVQNQMEMLNLADGPQSSDRMAAVDAQRRTSTGDGTPGYPGQSRSFRILQMMTGGDDATDSAQPLSTPAKRNDDEEMRFTGIRRPDNPIPSRAFQALQKMTEGANESGGQQADPRYGNESADEVRQEDGPVDIRYKGGYIPGRSFKMLQEMTGENGGGTVVPSVLQEKRQQRKPNLHLNINQPQSPVPKQFPQPSVPASQQEAEDAPKMYRGGRIPSQSFKILQAMTGESGDSQGEDGTDM
jgi:hypothetical protein